MDDSGTHDSSTPTSNREIEHVHIGAGLFGLGMVMDLCNTAGFYSAVLSRKSNKEHHAFLAQAGQYDVIYDGDKTQRRKISARFLYYETEHDAEAVDLLANPSVLLITTSVRKDNLSTIAPLLAFAIAHRRNKTDMPLCILACENMPNNSQVLRDKIRGYLSEEASTYFEREVVFCNTLVDRVCSDLEYAGSVPEVLVESFSEWIVQHPSIKTEAIARLEAHKLIELVDEKQFKAYELRKYWCLNGIHLAIAAFAFIHGKHIRTVSQALDIDEIRQTVNELQDEMSFALRVHTARQGIHNFFSDRALTEYNSTVLNRFAQNKNDTVGRILKHADELIGSSVQHLFDRFVNQISTGADHDTREKGLLALIAKAGALLDVHEVLDRVVERFIGPESEILAFEANLVDPNPKKLLFDSNARSVDRLVLDYVIQAAVIAVAEYTREQYAGMQGSMVGRIA